MALDVVWGGGVDGPDPSVVVGGAGGQVAHVGTDEDAGDVGVVGLEGGDGDEGGEVAVLDHAPDVDVALERKREKRIRIRNWWGKSSDGVINWIFSAGS